MLGASPVHALAPEHGLRPLLVELGAVVPTRGLYVLDSQHDRPETYDAWFATAQARRSCTVLTPPLSEVSA